jgi:hypothetical protein
VEELRLALLEFKETYYRQWIVPQVRESQWATVKAVA